MGTLFSKVEKGDVAQEFGWIGGAGLEFFWQSIEIAMAMVCMD